MAVTTLNHNGSATRRDGLEVIATFDDYAGAQAAVDQLSDDGFPVDRVRIVGDGLMVVEDVTGGRDSRRAAGEAAGYGAFVAGWLGLIFGLLDWYDPAQSALALALYGVVFGGVFGPDRLAGPPVDARRARLLRPSRRSRRRAPTRCSPTAMSPRGPGRASPSSRTRSDDGTRGPRERVARDRHLDALQVVLAAAERPTRWRPQQRSRLSDPPAATSVVFSAAVRGSPR